MKLRLVFKECGDGASEILYPIVNKHTNIKIWT
jgi:hypothetical protein